MLVVNWNIQWATHRSRRRNPIIDEIFDHSPEIICLTEAYINFLPEGGHTISSLPDYGYPIKTGRRKVLLWSKNPWEAIEQCEGSTLPPGRYVYGETNTTLGKIGIHGVCIPWASAHVTTGKKNRSTWEDHLNYLEGLVDILPEKTPRPQIILGDFNQRFPRKRVPLHVYEKLIAVLDGKFMVVTAGKIDGVNKQAIDHIGCTDHLIAKKVFSICNIDNHGKQLSDHFGTGAEFKKKLLANDPTLFLMVPR